MGLVSAASRDPMTTQHSGPSPSRRWLSFSLRGLFLVVTIGCVWLAVVTTRAEASRGGR
jgi:hypothetical protein